MDDRKRKMDAASPRLDDKQVSPIHFKRPIFIIPFGEE